MRCNYFSVFPFSHSTKILPPDDNNVLCLTPLVILIKKSEKKRDEQEDQEEGKKEEEEEENMQREWHCKESSSPKVNIKNIPSNSQTLSNNLPLLSSSEM